MSYYGVLCSRKSTIASLNDSFGKSPSICNISTIELIDPLSVRFKALIPLDPSFWSAVKQMILPVKRGERGSRLSIYSSRSYLD
jgi:hypothetical protein